MSINSSTYKSKKITSVKTHLKYSQTLNSVIVHKLFIQLQKDVLVRMKSGINFFHYTFIIFTLNSKTKNLCETSESHLNTTAL